MDFHTPPKIPLPSPFQNNNENTPQVWRPLDSQLTSSLRVDIGGLQTESLAILEKFKEKELVNDMVPSPRNN